MILDKKGVEIRFLILFILGLIALVVVVLIFYFGMDWFVGHIKDFFTQVNATRPDIPKIK